MNTCFFTKVERQCNGERIVCPQIVLGQFGYLYEKKKVLGSIPCIIYKNQLLNVKSKTIKFLGESTCDLRLARDLLDMTQKVLPSKG